MLAAQQRRLLLLLQQQARRAARCLWTDAGGSVVSSSSSPAALLAGPQQLSPIHAVASGWRRFLARQEQQQTFAASAAPAGTIGTRSASSQAFDAAARQHGQRDGSHNGGAVDDDGAADGADGRSSSYYSVPFHAVSPLDDPADVGQRRFAKRFEFALEAALSRDAVVREALVARYGLAVHAVRLSRDRRTLHVLWDALPGCAAACAAQLERCAFRLRRRLAKAVNSRHTPFIAFVHDRLPPRQAGVAAAIARVEREEGVDFEGGGGGGGGGFQGSGDGTVAAGARGAAELALDAVAREHGAAGAAPRADVDAAVAELEARLQARPARRSKWRGAAAAGDDDHDINY